MSHTIVNLKADVTDMAPQFGYAEYAEARFARESLELEQSGLSVFRLAAGYRMPFGHTHGEQEEIYVVLSGNARMKIGDEVVELAAWDAVRVPPGVWRGMEGAPPDGCEMIVFAAPNTRNRDVEMAPDWWSD